MGILSLLFNPHRKPSVADSIARPDDILQQSLVFVGGTVFVKGGLQIDATLKDVRVVAVDNKPIVLTALGTMQNCSIEGADVLVAGTFSGQVLARGDVEVTDTAEFSGSIRSSGVVVVNPLAGDADEITIGRLPPEAPKDITPKAVVEPVSGVADTAVFDGQASYGA